MISNLQTSLLKYSLTEPNGSLKIHFKKPVFSSPNKSNVKGELYKLSNNRLKPLITPLYVVVVAFFLKSLL